MRQGAAQAAVTASFDLAADHPALATLAEQGLDSGAGRAAGDPPHAARGRRQPRLRQRPAGVGRAAPHSSARAWSRSTASMTIAACSIRAATAPCSTPSRVPRLAGVAGAHARWRACEEAVAAGAGRPRRRRARSRVAWSMPRRSWPASPPSRARRRRWPPSARPMQKGARLADDLATLDAHLGRIGRRARAAPPGGPAAGANRGRARAAGRSAGRARSRAGRGGRGGGPARRRR